MVKPVISYPVTLGPFHIWTFYLSKFSVRDSLPEGRKTDLNIKLVQKRVKRNVGRSDRVISIGYEGSATEN